MELFVVDAYKWETYLILAKIIDSKELQMYGLALVCGGVQHLHTKFILNLLSDILQRVVPSINTLGAMTYSARPVFYTFTWVHQQSVC